MLEIAASLEVKPYLRVNPRRTLSPAHARAGLHRGCIYLPAGGGRTRTGTLARCLAPRCHGDTLVGTASHRGPVAVGEGGDRVTPGRSAHSATPLGHRLQNRVRPPPTPTLASRCRGKSKVPFHTARYQSPSPPRMEKQTPVSKFRCGGGRCGAPGWWRWESCSPVPPAPRSAPPR